MKNWLTILLISFFSTAAFAQEDRIHQVANSQAWLNLLYYEKEGSAYKSLVLDEKYFIDRENGAHDPKKELQASIQVFQATHPINESHPQCLFPARYEFLKDYFPLAAKVNCSKFNEWMRSYAPSKIYLVYASQFIANPASVFGHSFLLLESPRQVQSFWLTYNYAGNIPSDVNGFSYVFGGLTGWYPGDYSVMPFYHRIFQYGSIENRDLWLYEIRLSKKEKDFLIKHLWEIVHTGGFTYYFLDENCAGVLLRTFAAVLEDMRDENQLDFYVHPIEIITKLEDVGRIGELRVVPSQSSKLDYSVSILTKQQKSDFLQIIYEPKAPLPQDVSAKTLDAVIEYLAYERHKNQGELPQAFQALEKQVYIRRAKFAEIADSAKYEGAPNEAPHLAHRSQASSAGFSILNDEMVGNVSYRFATHNLMDREPGYIKNSSVEFFHLRLSANDEEVWVRDFSLINIENFRSFQSYRSSYSWGINLALKENILTERVSDKRWYTKASYGFTKDYSNLSLFSLLVGEINWGKSEVLGDLDLGPQIGAILSFHKWKLQARLRYGQDLLASSDTNFIRARVDWRYAISKNLSLLQENEWQEMLKSTKSEGYRSSMSIRYHF